MLTTRQINDGYGFKFFLGLLAISSGGFLVLAFAPFGYYLVAEIALLVLLWIWFRSDSVVFSFWSGWLFGLGFFGSGVYWVYISIHRYGHAPPFLGLSILLLLIAFLALYPGLLGYFLSRCYPKNSCYKFLLAFPAGWVILEWLRGWFLTGFPWLFLGDTQLDSPLRGWGTLLGVYGISFMVAQTSGAIFCLFYYRKNIKLVVSLTLLILALWILGANLANINWVKPVGKQVKVSLIQGNIPQQQKWEPENLRSILDTYLSLTKKSWQSQIIVWPEAAIPSYQEMMMLDLRSLSLEAVHHQTTLLTGIPFYESDTDKYYNGILALGNGSGRYYKRNLVPFGEYLPFKFALRWLHNFITIPMSDFSCGTKKQIELLAGKTIIAPFICYEIAYPTLVLEHLPEAGLLVTVSDDSWFGESIAGAQHLAIARMRSLESGRYQLFSSNTGISAIINSQGKVVDRLPEFTSGVLTGQVLILTGKTPWVSLGQYLWLWFAFFILFWRK